MRFLPRKRPALRRPGYLAKLRLPAPLARLWSRFFRGTRKVVAIGAAVIIIIVLPVVIWQLHSPTQKVDAAWFDANYGYRKKIPILNSSTAQTDFQVQLTVDTASLITANKMLSSCNDIRITDVSGKALSYWIEPGTCNTSSTLIWAKVTSIPTSGADIYVYYGNASASSNSSTGGTFIRDMSAAAVAWPLDDTVTTQSYSRAINPTLAAGRNIVLNGTFDTDTLWTKGTGWTIANGVTHSDGSAGVSNSFLTPTTALPMVIGRAYQITFTVANYSSGSVRGLIGNTPGTSRSANGTYTETLISNTPVSSTGVYTPGTAFVGDVDNVIITELNVPASPVINPTNLLTDGNMEAGTTAAWTSGNSATLSKVSGTAHGGSNVLRVARTTVTNAYAFQNILTAGTVYRFYGFARSDGTAVPFVNFQGSASLWTGTTATTWQAFDFSAVAPSTGSFNLATNASSGTPYVEFDDVTVVTDTALRSGELLQDGDMEVSDTTYWTTTNTTISKQTTTPHGGVNDLRVAYNGTANGWAGSTGRDTVIGKTYRVTGWARGDGTVIPKLATTGGGSAFWTGTSSNTWQSVDGIFVSDSGTSPFLLRPTMSSAGYAEYDDLSLTEISPMSGIPVNGVVLGTSSGVTHLTNAYTFDGTNDYVSIYSGTLNSVFNPSEGTLVLWAKVSGSGVWTDATFRKAIMLVVDGNNDIIIQKTSTSNQLVFLYSAGGTVSTITLGSQSSTGWMQLALSWSKSADQVKAYINGAQVGSTQTGLGTWVGNLISTQAVIGAQNSSGSQPWSGMINDTRLYGRALSAAEISDQYNASYDTQNYYTTNYPGQELIRKYNTGVTVGSAAAEETTPGAGLYWTMEEGQGTTVHDATLQANNGTLGGTTPPTWQTPDLCALGRCLYFDGLSSKVTGSKISKNTQTIGFWIKPAKADGLGILNLDGGTHKISTNSSGVITATGWSSPTYYLNGKATTTPTLTANAWNHVEISTGTGFDTTASFTLGTDGSTFTQGYLDELKFYPYARTAAQVQADYDGVAVAMGRFSQQGQQVSGLVAQWPLDDTTTTQSYNRVVNPGVATGRNIVLNGGFDDGSAWTTGSGWSIAGGVGVGTAVSGNLTQAILGIGKSYQITYTVAVTSGSVRAIAGGALGATRSTNGTYTETLIDTSNANFSFASVSTFTGTIDNVTVTELNIPNSPATQPTQLQTDGDMEAVGTAAYTSGNSATLSKDVSAPHGGTQSLMVARSTVAQPSARTQAVLTVGQTYRIYGYARSDGNATPRVMNNAGLTAYFTGTTSTSWQPIDATFVADATQILLQANTSTGTQYAEFDDIVLAQDNFIRNGDLMSTIDGNMEQSGTNFWIPFDANNTLSKSTSVPHGGAQDLHITSSAVDINKWASQAVLVQGKTYRATGWARSDGTAVPRVSYGKTNYLFIGTTSTSWQFFDVTGTSVAAASVPTNIYFGSNNDGTIGDYTEFDDITVIEVAPLVGLPVNGVTLGASTGAGGHGTTAASFDGTNDNVNIYSGSLNSAFNPSEGSVVAWAKVTSSGVWTDGTLRDVLQIGADTSSNRVRIAKSGTSNNRLVFTYDAGGTDYTVNLDAVSSTSWMQMVISWSKSSDQVKMYLNGSQVGSTLTGVATWSGNLSSTTASIGAAGSGAANPWSGSINDVRLYNRALTPAEISGLYGPSGSTSSAGPVGWWKLDDGTGTTTIDSSGNNNTGTLTNGPTWTQGQRGKAVSFDGTNDYIDGGTSTTLQPTTAISFGGWVKWNAFASNNSGHAIISYSDNAANGYAVYQNTVSPFNKAKTFVFTTNGIGVAVGTTSLNTGSWYFIYTTYDGTTLKLYVNGVLDSSTAVTGNINYTSITNHFFIGQGMVSGSSLNGNIDDVKVYNYARTQTQILEDMNAQSDALAGGSLGALPKPLAYYAFDEQQGQTANNSGTGGSSLNGTLGASTSVSTDDPTWKTKINCKVNGCLSFDGGDFVDLGDMPAVEAVSQMTLSAWANPSSAQTITCIFCKVNFGSGATQAGIGLETYLGSAGSTHLLGYVPTTLTDGSTFGNTADFVLPNNQWTHVVMVFDGTQTGNANRLKIYVNGQQRTLSFTGTIPAVTLATTSNLRVGAASDSASNRFFSGLIDEPKVYNTALTADQVKQDYNNGASLSYGSAAADQATLMSDGAGAAPIAYWPMDEKTGTTANDTSGNTNTGTWQGTTGNQWTQGKNGAAGNFNGTDNYISTTTSQGANPGATTSEAWFKTTVASGHVIIGMENNQTGTGSNLDDRQVYMGTDGKIYYYTFNGAAHYLTSTGTYNDGRWHFVAATNDGTTGTLYVDGISQGSTAGAGYASYTSSYWRIGSYFLSGKTNASNGYFTGQIDDVKIYNYARTQAQVAYDYNRGGPIGYWQFDECQGSTANDASGNGNNGTIAIGPSGTQTSLGSCGTTSSTASWSNGAVGKYNASLSLDGGTDDTAHIPDSNSLDVTGVVSVAAWFKINTSLGGGFQTILGKRSASINSANYALRTGSGGSNNQLQFYFSSGGQFQVYTTNNANLSVGNWYHTVAVYTVGSLPQIYLNGVLLTGSCTSNTCIGAMSADTNTLGIGGAGDFTTEPFKGQIDDVRIYNYALSLSQIQQLYNQASSVRFGPTSGSP